MISTMFKFGGSVFLAPCYTAMIIMRKDFGKEMFSLPFVFICSILLIIIKFPFALIYNNQVGHLAIFVAFSNAMLLYTWIHCWLKRGTITKDSSRFQGRTRFRWLWAKVPGASNGKLLQILYEPLLVFLVGTIIAGIGGLQLSLGRYIQFSAFLLAAHSWRHFAKLEAQAQQIEDMKSLQLEAAGATQL